MSDLRAIGDLTDARAAMINRSALPLSTQRSRDSYAEPSARKTTPSMLSWRTAKMTINPLLPPKPAPRRPNACAATVSDNAMGCAA